MIDELMTMDMDGDGLDESLLYFDENDGYIVFSDYNNDGNYEQMTHLGGLDYWGNPTEVAIALDTDNNGIYDTVMVDYMNEFGTVVSHAELSDYDQDGKFDMTKIFHDATGDGQFDVVTTAHSDNTESDVIYKIDSNVDLTGDQTPDATMNAVVLDSNGDNQPDTVEYTVTGPSGEVISDQMAFNEFIIQNPGFADYSTICCSSSNMAIAAQYDPSMSDPDMVSGDPLSDMERWEYQGNTGRCAIYAQKFVIEEAIGREVPIEELVAVAEENGWFNEASGGGTTTLNMGKLLDYYGVDYEMSFDNDIESLENALKDGKNVIVGVDSGQYWFGQDNNIFSPETRADHAVQVIGIDRTDPDNPMVILNDSGTPDGCGELVPLEIFENAWNAGDAQMIVS